MRVVCFCFFFPMSYFQWSLSLVPSPVEGHRGSQHREVALLCLWIHQWAEIEGRGYLFTFHAEIRLMKIFTDENVLLKHLVESVWLLLINPEGEKKARILC